MSKRGLIAVVVVFVVWQIMDFVIHAVILAPQYMASASLWRPQGEMKMGLLMVAGFIASICFCLIYDRFFATKNVGNGLLYGLIFGVGTGVSMGYGSYSVMPMPYMLALGWFLGALAEAVVAGVIVGAIIKD